MHPSDDMEFEMQLNEKEQDVFWSCQNRLSFVTAMLDQSDGVIELSWHQKMGLIVVLSDVLLELDAIDTGKYCDSQTASAVSEERTLADSEAAHQNEQAEARGVQ